MEKAKKDWKNCIKKKTPAPTNACNESLTWSQAAPLGTMSILFPNETKRERIGDF
jgi:hypothetical protein